MRVVLKIGPLAVWETRDERVTSAVLMALQDRLLRVALSKRLPRQARRWAEAKLSELERLGQLSEVVGE